MKWPHTSRQRKPATCFESSALAVHVGCHGSRAAVPTRLGAPGSNGQEGRLPHSTPARAGPPSAGPTESSDRLVHPPQRLRRRLGHWRQPIGRNRHTHTPSSGPLGGRQERENKGRASSRPPGGSQAHSGAALVRGDPTGTATLFVAVVGRQRGSERGVGARRPAAAIPGARARSRHARPSRHRFRGGR